MIVLSVDVTKADVPFLLGLDVMDRFGLYLNTVENKLVCPTFGWKMDVRRKLGHVYLEWNERDRIVFTRAELTKLYRNFYHPGVENLMNLIKQVRPSEFNAETSKILQGISDACDTCLRFGPRPLRFIAALPIKNELIFGQELSVDLTWIDGKAVLHVIDTATRFSTATFLDSSEQDYGQSVEGVWRAMMECWFAMYTGYPEKIRAGASSIFYIPKMEGTNHDGWHWAPTLRDRGTLLTRYWRKVS